MINRLLRLLLDQHYSSAFHLRISAIKILQSHAQRFASRLSSAIGK